MCCGAVQKTCGADVWGFIWCMQGTFAGVTRHILLMLAHSLQGSCKEHASMSRMWVLLFRSHAVLLPVGSMSHDRGSYIQHHSLHEQAASSNVWADESGDGGVATWAQCDG